VREQIQRRICRRRDVSSETLKRSCLLALLLLMLLDRRVLRRVFPDYPIDPTFGLGTE
jgi:hypothetical protein